MTVESKLLIKLKEQEQALKEKIKEAQKAEKKKQAAAHAKKCAIVGAAILEEMENNQSLKSTLEPIINRLTIASSDRKVLGLEPLPKKEKTKEEDEEK